MQYQTPFEKHQQGEKEMPQQSQTRYEWASAIASRIERHKRDTYISPLVTWYHAENAKRAKKECNELDIADAKAAAKGVRNRWFECATKFPREFEEIITVTKGNVLDWSKLMELKEKSV